MHSDPYRVRWACQCISHKQFVVLQKGSFTRVEVRVVIVLGLLVQVDILQDLILLHPKKTLLCHKVEQEHLHLISL